MVLTLDRPSMAEKIDRALTSRGAARSVSGLAAMLAHEIRNPLSGIRGAAQLLEPALDEDDRALARLIMAETDRIVKLVDRMEIFGDARPVQRAPVIIHDVLDHVERLARSGFARAIEIRAQTDGLTGLLNHATFEDQLGRAVREGAPFGLIVLQPSNGLTPGLSAGQPQEGREESRN